MKEFFKFIFGALMVFGAVLLSSCSSKSENPIEVGKQLVKLYSIGDSLRIFEMRRIPNEVSRDEKEVDQYEDIKADIHKDILEFKGKNYEVMKLDTMSEITMDYTGRKTNSKFITCYLKIDTSLFLMDFKYEQDSLGRVNIKSIVLRNLLKYCRFEELAALDVRVETFLWSAAGDKTFKNVVLRIRNGNNERVKHLKLRLILSERDSYKEFFSKTLDYEVDIAPSDLFDVEVKELSMYPAGISIRDSGNWMWEASILEVEPTGSGKYCKELAKATGLASQ